MKTALQEYIETLEKTKLNTGTKYADAHDAGIHAAIYIAKSILPKSEAEIKEAYEDGFKKGYKPFELAATDQYFNDKYGTQ